MPLRLVGLLKRPGNKGRARASKASRTALAYNFASSRIIILAYNIMMAKHSFRHKHIKCFPKRHINFHTRTASPTHQLRLKQQGQCSA
jgi:hypothetical protein